MSLVVALARLLLAGVFVVSAVAKLRDRSGSREAVLAFGVPRPLVGLVAAGLPVAELACAALLVAADPAAVVGAVASLLLLTAFTVAVVVNLLRGRRPDCHCFGSLSAGGAIGWTTVVRNVVLLGLAAVALVGAGGRGSVPAVLADLEPGELAGLGAGTGVLGALVGMALALRTLMVRYGAVLLRVEALERSAGLAPQPMAPEFALPDLDGEVVTLDDVLSAGRPALLVFVSPTCSNCTELLPDLATWQNDPEHPLSVVVISDGTVQENRAKIADVGPLRVLLQRRFEVADSYGAQGTPVAFLIGAEGRRAGDAVYTVGSIRHLHGAITRSMTAGQADPHDHERLHVVQPRPVAVGDPVPEGLVEPESGDELALPQALGEEAVLLFWRVDCGFCQGLVDDVRAFEEAVPLRIVTGSDLAAVRDSGLVSPVLRDPAGTLGGWLRIPGTPSAARVRDGVLASDVAVGGPDVLALLQASSRSAAAVD